MALVDQIEQLGAAVDAGLLSHDAAVQQLVEYADGELTRLGAEVSLDRWRTVRADYGATFAAARADLAFIRDHKES